MLKVNFILNEKYLLFYVLSNYKDERLIEHTKSDYKEYLVNFQNLAWNKSKTLYQILDGRINPFEIKAQDDNYSFSKIETEIDSYVNDLLKSNAFKILLEQTKEGIELCKKEWQTNFEQSSSYLADLGLIPEGTFEILMVHGGLKAGRYMGDNKICWSYQHYWDNYNTVYLWHEMLHSYFGKTEMEHALIELITDNEMRIRLNGGTYPPLEGHKNLNRHKEMLLPLWKDFLGQDKKDIKQFSDVVKKLTVTT